jgi:hypothetical protein
MTQSKTSEPDSGSKRRKRRANGEGGLHRCIKNGRPGWKAVIYLPNGGEKTAWAEKQSDAKDKLDKLKKTWLGAATVTDETVAEYLDWWLASRWDYVTKEQKAEKTVIDYQNSLSYVKSRLGHLKLAELTSAHVYDLLVHLSKYGKTHSFAPGG